MQLTSPLFLLALVAAPQALAQSVTVSISLSVEQGFTGNRVPFTTTHSIPVTITLSQSPTGTPSANATVSGSQAQNATVSGNATSQTGTLSSASHTSTSTSSLPSAPAATGAVTGSAPLPGATGSTNAGPDDNYVAAAIRGASFQATTALVVGMLGACIGVGQFVGLV